MTADHGATFRLAGEMTESPGTALSFYAREIEVDCLDRARIQAFARGSVCERDGATLLGWGLTAQVELAGGIADPAAVTAAGELIAAIGPYDGDSLAVAPGGAVAIGALPFDPDARGRLVLPKLVVLAATGSAPVAIAIGNRTELGAAAGEFPFEPNDPSPRLPSRTPPPDSFELTSVRSHDDFCERVAEALEAIGRGELQKVVLAREVKIQANRPFAQADLLERLRRLHPSCFSFAVDGFLGASPELLCRRRGATVLSRPLAGTVARSGDPDEDARLAAALLSSSKERAEHRFVVDAIAATLAPFSATVETEETPHLLALRNVAHLATDVTARLAERESGELPSVLELVGALHPTPAVGGFPKLAALDYLAKHEGIDRDRYAGPVGYVRGNGDGEWWLGIRSALIEGRVARLFAGVGIVDGSVPRDELTETQLKLQALLAAAVRP